MRNILVLGNPDSLFVRDFCIKVLNERELKVAILGKNYSGYYARDYQDYSVTIIQWPDFFLHGFRENFSTDILKKYNRCIEEIIFQTGFDGQIDVIFVHFVEPIFLMYFYPLWKKSKKRILVFWGDDILRASRIKLKLLSSFLKQAISIIFMVQSQYEYFRVQLGEKYDDKIQIIDFGNSTLDWIDKINSKYTKSQCKERFGFSTDKVVVHVGYNAFRGQQHMDIMKNIAKWAQLPLTNKWTDKIEFIFHISYGQNGNFRNYIAELKEIMNKVSLDYSFIETYLQGSELAIFRRTCDIFIYGQKTDACSASPLEYLYAGAQFICPNWLYSNYSMFEQADIPFYIYEDFTDMINAFSKCLLKLEKNTVEDNLRKEAVQRQKKIIRDAVSWDELAPKWRSLYE